MSREKFDLEITHPKLKSCFNFQKDLELGRWGENYVNSILSNPNVKIEVKKDDWTIRSGNLGIEFESRGKPSGIAVTTADFWCFVVGHFYVLMMPTKFLKWIVKEGYGEVKAVGDRDKSGKPTSKCVLLPWKNLLTHFQEYNTLQHK